jgi:hypothetical protein
MLWMTSLPPSRVSTPSSTAPVEEYYRRPRSSPPDLPDREDQSEVNEVPQRVAEKGQLDDEGSEERIITLGGSFTSNMYDWEDLLSHSDSGALKARPILLLSIPSSWTPHGNRIHELTESLDAEAEDPRLEAASTATSSVENAQRARPNHRRTEPSAKLHASSRPDDCPSTLVQNQQHRRVATISGNVSLSTVGHRRAHSLAPSHHGSGMVGGEERAMGVAGGVERVMGMGKTRPRPPPLALQPAAGTHSRDRDTTPRTSYPPPTAPFPGTIALQTPSLPIPMPSPPTGHRFSHIPQTASLTPPTAYFSNNFYFPDGDLIISCTSGSSPFTVYFCLHTQTFNSAGLTCVLKTITKKVDESEQTTQFVRASVMTANEGSCEVAAAGIGVDVGDKLQNRKVAGTETNKMVVQPPVYHIDFKNSPAGTRGNVPLGLLVAVWEMVYAFADGE